LKENKSQWRRRGRAKVRKDRGGRGEGRGGGGLRQIDQAGEREGERKEEVLSCVHDIFCGCQGSVGKKKESGNIMESESMSVSVKVVGGGSEEDVHPQPTISPRPNFPLLEPPKR